MTITYPRELPDYRLVDCTFNLNEPVSISRTHGGRGISAVEYADPYITATIQTGPIGWHERNEWEAWRASLRGGLRSFVTHDVSRERLAAYPDGVPQIVAGTWNGQGGMSAIAPHLVTATGAPSGFTMSAGDLIGLVQGGRRAVFFVSETVTRGASTIAVPVEPAVPTNIFTTAATVVFYRPKAEFILLSETWRCSKQGFLAQVSFDAGQKI